MPRTTFPYTERVRPKHIAEWLVVHRDWRREAKACATERAYELTRETEWRRTTRRDSIRTYLCFTKGTQPAISVRLSDRPIVVPNQDRIGLDFQLRRNTLIDISRADPCPLDVFEAYLEHNTGGWKGYYGSRADRSDGIFKEDGDWRSGQYAGRYSWTQVSEDINRRVLGDSEPEVPDDHWMWSEVIAQDPKVRIEITRQRREGDYHSVSDALERADRLAEAVQRIFSGYL